MWSRNFVNNLAAPRSTCVSSDMICKNVSGPRKIVIEKCRLSTISLGIIEIKPAKNTLLAVNHKMKLAIQNRNMKFYIQLNIP